MLSQVCFLKGNSLLIPKIVTYSLTKIILKICTATTCHFKKICASKTKDTEHENFNEYKKKETHSNDILSKLLYGFFTVVDITEILFVIAGSL